MNEQQIQVLIDASVARALAAKDSEIADAIAFGLRTYADRPVGEKGSPSLQYGVVESVEDTWAMVTLDGQTDAVPINMLGGLVVGERVAVLLVPPSGNLAIGMFQPTVIPGSGSLTALVEAFFDPSPVSRTSGGRLDWVLDANIVDPPSDTLLDLSTPSVPAVLADGYYTFDMYAFGPPLGSGVGPFYAYVNYGITDSTATQLKLFGQAGFALTHNPGDNDNKASFSFSYPCVAGDLPFVTHQDDTGGANVYTLGGSVKLLSVS